jgi:hypothetical protein
MTKKSNSPSDETVASDILDDISPAVDEVVDVTVSDEAAVSEEPTATKKKTVSRKKATGSTEAKAKKAPVKRSRSTKNDKTDSSLNAPVMKAFWGVFNPMMVQVAQYNYADEAEAQKAAADMTEKKKAPHFVQLTKKVL